MTEPTKRQLDALAAWWKAGGTNTGAAALMAPTYQHKPLDGLHRQDCPQCARVA